MKESLFSKRLHLALNESGIKQIELANKTKIDKSLINKYIKGITEPGNENLTHIAEVLNVNEGWLKGYDVPKERYSNFVIHDDEKKQFLFYFGEDKLLEQYKILFDKDYKLTDNQKEFIMNTIKEQHKKYDNDKNEKK